MEGFWNLQSHEYQLETIKLVERLLNHYISHSQLSMEVNLSVFAGFMMYRLNGSFKSWPRGKDFDWVRNFLDDLIHHSHANEEAQVLLTELQHKFS